MVEQLSVRFLMLSPINSERVGEVIISKINKKFWEVFEHWYYDSVLR